MERRRCAAGGSTEYLFQKKRWGVAGTVKKFQKTVELFAATETVVMILRHLHSISNKQAHMNILQMNESE
jgi:hypothetical protein